jgi:hypothetical protein
MKHECSLKVSKNIQVSTLPVRPELFHEEGRTDWHDEANSRFFAILLIGLKVHYWRYNCVEKSTLNRWAARESPALNVTQPLLPQSQDPSFGPYSEAIETTHSPTMCTLHSQTFSYNSTTHLRFELPNYFSPLRIPSNVFYTFIISHTSLQFLFKVCSSCSMA